jgi:hypothetical protein
MKGIGTGKNGYEFVGLICARLSNPVLNGGQLCNGDSGALGDLSPTEARD